MEDGATIDATYEKIEEFDQSTPSYPPLNNDNLVNNYSQFGTTAEPLKYEPPKSETVEASITLEVISQVSLIFFTSIRKINVFHLLIRIKILCSLKLKKLHLLAN